MKQIGNLSVYKLLGYVILGIGAIAFVNASTGKIQANAPVPEANTQYSRSRHTINLVLNELDELKVTEGQRVNVGDIISDRTSAREKLLAKKGAVQNRVTVWRRNYQSNRTLVLISLADERDMSNTKGINKN